MDKCLFLCKEETNTNIWWVDVIWRGRVLSLHNQMQQLFDLDNFILLTVPCAKDFSTQ